MTNVQMWSLVVGFFSPLVLSVIQQPSWSNAVRSVVAFVYSAIAAAGTLYFTDTATFTSKNYVTTFLTVFVATIAFYRGFWRTTDGKGNESVTSKIERKTSPGA